MFVRCKKRRKDGKEHRYWSVVENVRVRKSRVVQRQVLYLGEINDSQRAVAGTIGEHLHVVVEMGRGPGVGDALEGEASAPVRTRIAQAQRTQRQRWETLIQDVAGDTLREGALLSQGGERLLGTAQTKRHFSQRRTETVLRVARTIADLARSERVEAEHIAEAVGYRALVDALQRNDARGAMTDARRMDRRNRGAALLAQLLHLIGVAHERPESVADEVRRRLVAGDHDDTQHVCCFGVVDELSPCGFAPEQTDHIVGLSARALGETLAEIPRPTLTGNGRSLSLGSGRDRRSLASALLTHTTSPERSGGGCSCGAW